MDSVEFQRELISDAAFLAQNCTVLGDVTIGDRSSIWFGAVIRGDVEKVTIGSHSNVQDLCMLHADPGFPCQVGDHVTIGHSAIVHGAKIASHVLIGMGAIILNGAQIRPGSIIAAGAVVSEGTLIPENSLVMGVPGKVRRETDDLERDRITMSAIHYAELTKRYDNRLHG